MTTPNETLTHHERELLTATDEFPPCWVTDKALRIIDARDACIAELEADVRTLTRHREERNARVEQLTNLLARWINFDFDCPEEEYDEENDDYEEDGSALNRLYADTKEALRG